MPGGNTDIIGRIFTPRMSAILGQQIIVDNRGGAGGTIGTDYAVRQAPDGYTLLMVSAGHTINPAMIKKLPYDSIKDFAPIGIIADVPTAFVVHPSLPAKNIKQFPSMPAAVPLVASGKLRMIGQTGKKRSPAAPDVPTIW